MSTTIAPSLGLIIGTIIGLGLVALVAAALLRYLDLWPWRRR